MIKRLPTIQETGFNPWVGKISWRRKWQPTPVFLPGKSHGWRSLVGYSPWGRKESDMTEQLHFHLFTIAKMWRQPKCALTGDTESEVAQSCPTLCDPMDCSLPGSSIYGIFQATELEWVAISFSRGSSRPRDRTLVSCTVEIGRAHV